jgi:uncharacterized protein with FMN-binding domain
MDKKSGIKQYKCYILLAVILVAGIAIAGFKSVQSASEVLYNAGTYTGEGQGYGGKITVEITVDANSITDVKVTHENETKGIGGREAVEDGTFAQQIMDMQSTEIDGVSTASHTTAGVKEALADALAQAAVSK